MTEKTLVRYLKIKALAEGGDDGEKDTAQKLLREFEGRHPGIAEAAKTYQLDQESVARGATPSSPSRTHGRWPLGGNWEEIFRYAAGFYQTMQGVVEDVTDAYYGKTLAEDEVIFQGTSRNDHLYVRMKVSFEAVDEARSLNAVQKEAFRRCIHEQLEGYLDALLQE